MRNLNTIINKSDKYLVKLFSQNKDKKHVVIKDSAGKPFHYLPDINNVVRTFYMHLYTSNHDPNMEDIHKFLSAIDLSILTQDQGTMLDKL